MQLRPYQSAALDKVRAEFSGGAQGVLLLMPTGAGKTVTGATGVGNALRGGLRVLWMADRRELVDQAAGTFRALGLNPNIAMSGAWRDEGSPLTIALVDSLVARPQHAPEGVGLHVLDECHLGRADKWLKVLALNPEGKRLGLTATPERSDGKALGDVFDVIVQGPTIVDLIELEKLVPVDVIAPEDSGSWLAQDPVEAYLEHGGGRPGFIFAKNVELSKQYAQTLRHRGVRAEHLDGSTKKSRRSQVVQQFREGEVDMLCSVDLFTRGFDAPRAEVCVLARPTTMDSVYLQAVGRVLRPFLGKSRALVLDLPGATRKLGHPECPRVYSLEGKPIRPLEEEGEAVVRYMTCASCFAIQPPRADRTCRVCGAIIPTQGIEVKPAKLTRVSPAWRGKNTPIEEKVQAYLRFQKEQRERGYKGGYAMAKYRGFFGERPPTVEALRERMRDYL